MEYVPRLLDEELQKRLASAGAVVIEGPKACGKTSTARQVATLLDGRFEPSPDPGLDVSELARLIAVGGWPGNLNLNEQQALQAVRDYLNEIRRADIRRLDETRRDPTRVAALLRSLARNVATHASNTTLAADAGGPDDSLSRDTVREYLSALDRLMIVEDQPAWAPHLRSKSRIRSAAKRHLVDPSLAVAALRASPERLLDDLERFGFVYESMVIRDLRVYSQLSGGTVLQYRDTTGLEVDAVIETADGRWAAFEIKLGTGRIDEAAASLRKFVSRVDTDRAGDPSILGVIVGSGYGYMREDDVAVLPVGALGP